MEIAGLCLPLKPQKERGYFGLSIIDSAGSPLEHIKLNKTVSFGYQIMSAKHEGRRSTDGDLQDMEIVIDFTGHNNLRAINCEG